MKNGRTRSLHWWISIALIAFGLLMVATLTLQSLRSQALVEHRIWRNILESVALTYAEQRALHADAPLPRAGILRSWLVYDNGPAPGMPAFLQPLGPGYYSSEGWSEGWSELEGAKDAFHALVTPLGSGKLVTYLDIGELEAQQNHDAMMTGLWGVAFIALIAAVIGWLHTNLVRPVRDLADRVQAIDPAIKGQRLPTTYRQQEIQIIARASNTHLERVEKFIERERSLLDQASHEFRTPISVIAWRARCTTSAGAAGDRSARPGAYSGYRRVFFGDHGRPALSGEGNAVLRWSSGAHRDPHAAAEVGGGP